MSDKEAHARIKIDQLLIESDWRFQDNESGDANILLEQNVKLTETRRDELGSDFEKTRNGFTDYSLLGESGRVICVIEAKAEHLNPLIGKEQARLRLQAKRPLRYPLKRQPALFVGYLARQSLRHHEVSAPRRDLGL